MRILVLTCVMAAGLWAGNDPPAQHELERINSLIEELTALKAQTAAIEGRLETLLRALQEQRGALQAKPTAYDALKATAGAADSPAETKPAAVRCAALTASGKRCTRPAMEGSRYCKQHALARQK
jgi:hypothetical protein